MSDAIYRLNLRDRSKGRTAPDSGMGERRWYVTPSGLVTPEDIPLGWGLAEVGGRGVRIVVDAPRRTVFDHTGERLVLASAVQRHELGVPWHAKTARFAPWSRAR